MPFDITEFNATIKSLGITRSHDYTLVIYPPAGMGNSPEFTQLARVMTFTVDAVNFPGTGALPYPAQRYAYGAHHARPLLPKFSPLQCTLISDQAGIIQRFFSEWVKMVCNYDFSQGIQGNTGDFSPMAPYELSYQDEYTTDINLQIFNPIGEMIRDIIFRQAWPMTVEDVSYNWAKLGDYVKIPVTFGFTDYFDQII